MPGTAPQRGIHRRGLAAAIATLLVAALVLVLAAEGPAGAGADPAAAPAAVVVDVPPVAIAAVPALPALPAATITAPLPPPPPPPTTTTAPPAPPRRVRVAFLGDSVAWTTAGAIAPHADLSSVDVLNHGIWGCGVVRGVPFRYFGATLHALPNDCDHWPEQWAAAVDRHRPDVAVVMVGRWELMDRVHNGVWTHVGETAFDDYLRSELDLAIATAGSRGARVVVATTPYYRRGDAPGGGTWPEDDPARVHLVNHLLREAAARHPGVAVVDFGSRLSPGGALAMEIDGVRVRTDGVHVAAESGSWLSPWLLHEIRTAAGY